MNKVVFFRGVLACLVAIVVASVGSAQNFLEKHAATIKPYLTSDVVGIGYVDLENFDLGKSIEFAKQIGFGEDDRFTDMIEATPVIQTELKQLKDAGLSSAIILLRMSDIQNFGTSFVFPVTEGIDPRTAAKALAAHSIGQSPTMRVFDSGDGVVFAATTQSQLDRLKNDIANEPRDLSEPCKAIGGGAAGVVLFGDSDSRRVVRELFPKLPGPFAALTGKMVADDLKWAGAWLDMNGSVDATVKVKTNNAEAAKTIANATEAGVEMMRSLPQLAFLDKEQMDLMADSLSPSLDGDIVTLSTKMLTADKDRLAKVLTPMVGKVKGAAQKANRVNMLRQLALAMHNYESAHRHFPAQAIVDKAGKPLLSWRVSILPFIEQNDLYNEFHLDEPWDSEHNLKLVEKMPKAYADKSRENNKAGKTIFLVPAGKGLMFDGGNEIGFGKITDGSSNTMLLICVAQKHAVIWTKPDDWEVDFANVKAKLEEDGRTSVEVSLADGSSHSFSLKTPNDKWMPLIKHNDGEIVDGSDFGQ